MYNVFMLSRLNHALYRYYFLTWVMLLLIFKRRIPKWLQEEAKERIKPIPPLKRITDLNR